MNHINVNFDLPRDLLGTLNISESELQLRLKELIALELFREGSISTGKAAELLGISKHDFILLLNRHTVPYFTETPEELAQQILHSPQPLGK